jgi:hypothetical protein
MEIVPSSLFPIPYNPVFRWKVTGSCWEFSLHQPAERQICLTDRLLPLLADAESTHLADSLDLHLLERWL